MWLTDFSYVIICSFGIFGKYVAGLVNVSVLVLLPVPNRGYAEKKNSFQNPIKTIFIILIIKTSLEVSSANKDFNK